MVFLHNRKPTDPVYISKLKLVSLLLDFGYVVYDKDDLMVTNGDYTVNPIIYSSVLAYSTTDAISIYYLKYGNLYKKSTFAITDVETLLFMAQEVNSNVVLDEISVAALTGISVNKVTKEITISESHSVNNIYDYLQYYQSLAVNTDTLHSGEIFSTVLGTRFTLNSAWKLIFSVQPIGAFLIVGDVIFSTQFNVSEFDVEGTLFFGGNITMTALNCNIGNINTLAGQTVSYTPDGDSNIPNNLDAVNITIEVAPTTFTISGLVVGSDVVILEQGTSNVLASVDQTVGTTFQYIYNGAKTIDIGIIKPSFVTQYFYGYYLNGDNTSLPVKQLVDRNYL